MDVRPLHESTRRYARKSIMAFLAGEQDKTWILGVLRSAGLDATTTRAFLADLQGYGSPDRYAQLVDALAASDGR